MTQDSRLSDCHNIRVIIKLWIEQGPNEINTYLLWSLAIVISHFPNFLALSAYFFKKTKMADLMWGGVPFTIPSLTAMKYISGAVKVQVGS